LRELGTLLLSKKHLPAPLMLSCGTEEEEEEEAPCGSELVSCGELGSTCGDRDMDGLQVVGFGVERLRPRAFGA
jgi:hypothetical protein